MSACVVNACTRRVLARGLCHGHYEWCRRNPGQTPTHRLKTDFTPEEKFWARVDFNGPRAAGLPDRCWIWTGATGGEGRYGLAKFGPTLNGQAHSISYRLLIGGYDMSLDLDHLCKVTLCVNPWHVEPVTHTENLRRGNGWGGVNARKTQCPRGHAYPPSTGPRGQCLGCRELRNMGRRALGNKALMAEIDAWLESQEAVAA